jgi:hypothetical protein
MPVPMMRKELPANLLITPDQFTILGKWMLNVNFVVLSIGWMNVLPNPPNDLQNLACAVLVERSICPSLKTHLQNSEVF